MNFLYVWWLLAARLNSQILGGDLEAIIGDVYCLEYEETDKNWITVGGTISNDDNVCPFL